MFEERCQARITIGPHSDMSRPIHLPSFAYMQMIAVECDPTDTVSAAGHLSAPWWTIDRPAPHQRHTIKT